MSGPTEVLEACGIYIREKRSAENPSGQLVAELLGDAPGNAERARRLAACWNACQSLSTEQVEQINGLLPARLAYQAMQRDREVLLDALERTRSLLAVSEGQFNGEFQARARAAITQAREAIATATGAAT